MLAHLLAGPDVAAVVGSRGYLLKLPQKVTLPALVTQLIDQPEEVTLDGELTNFFRARIQVDIYAAEADAANPYVTVRTGDRAVRNRLALKSAGGQVFTSGSPSDVRVSSVQPLDLALEYEPDELQLVRARRDFFVTYQDAA